MATNNLFQQAVAAVFGISVDSKPEVQAWEGGRGVIRIGDIAKNFKKGLKKVSLLDLSKSIIDLTTNKKNANWTAIDAATGKDFGQCYKQNFQRTKEEDFASIIINLMVEADRQGVDIERSIELYRQYIQNNDLFVKAAKAASEQTKKINKQNKGIETVADEPCVIKTTVLSDPMHWPNGIPKC